MKENESVRLEKLLVKVLADYQMIESELRQLVISKHEMILKLTNEWTKYTYDHKKILKMGLGQLVSAYKQLSNNDSFINTLGELVEKRNDIAHNAFNRIYNKNKNNSLKITEEIHSLEDISHKIDAFMYLLLVEVAESLKTQMDVTTFVKKHPR